MLTAQEQRKRDLQAAADARMQRLVRLNEMENSIAASDAVFEQLERRRLSREAAERQQRIAAFERKQAQRVAVGPARVSVERVGGRRCEVTRRGSIIERRFLD